MSVKKQWLKLGSKVITVDGFGTVSSLDWTSGAIEVELTKPFAEKKVGVYSQGQVTLDSDFAVLRLINLRDFGPMGSVVNYPSWLDAYSAADDPPFIQDETLLAINFKTQLVLKGRPLPGMADYAILSVSYCQYVKLDFHGYEGIREAVKYWETFIDSRSIASSKIEMVVLLSFALDKPKVLARKLLSTMAVLKDDKWY